MKRQSLGQHYLVDHDVIRKILAAAKLEGNEAVLEIGTGKGALTSELKNVCSKLDGYEIDRNNLEETRKKIGKSSVNLHLVDVFKTSPNFEVLVSSLPYSRSADFVEWLSQQKYDRAVVLLQEDFVEKITSPPGYRDYRAVSVIAQISSDIRLGEKVPRQAFLPQPRVSSRLVTFVPKTRLAESQLMLIKRLFTLRRRTLSSVFTTLKIRNDPELGEPGRRLYQLPPDEIFRIVAMVSRTR
jgi:16S rRNA (adenine1518-N6/adenine1519-N6)-dimethyltransferase